VDRVTTTGGNLHFGLCTTVRTAPVLIAAFLAGLGHAGEFPELRGPYLGQEPPRHGAEVFLPDCLRPPSGFHSSVVFNGAGDEACWTEMGEGRTFCSTIVDGRWTRPEALQFDPEFGVREPMFAADDRRLYFISRRPLDHDPIDRERIWFVEREGAGWSRPRVVDDVVTAHPTHWQFSFTAAGDLYFTSETDGVRGEQDIYVARFRDGEFLKPESAGDRINSDVRDFCPFVAPDESYLIFARSVPEARGRSDLFISFRGGDGLWTEATNMGDDVNSPANEVSPVVTPDGRYLVFLRVSGVVNDVYWISADVIETLRRNAGAPNREATEATTSARRTSNLTARQVDGLPSP